MYASDTWFASSSATATPAPFSAVLTSITNSTIQLTFTNVAGTSFTILGTTNLLASPNDWINLGLASEVFPGHYEFSEAISAGKGSRFYRVRSP